jgi:hypothetical protein
MERVELGTHVDGKSVINHRGQVRVQELFSAPSQLRNLDFGIAAADKV